MNVSLYLHTMIKLQKLVGECGYCLGPRYSDCLIEAMLCSPSFKCAKIIHGFMKKNEMIRINVFVHSTLIEFYSRC
jgi:hypothetical protein